MNKYIDAFLSEITWFKSYNIELLKEEKMVVPDAFTRKFPKLSKLLNQAVKLEIVAETKTKNKTRETYWLICWTKGNTIRGWLCLPPLVEIAQSLPESYRMVLAVFGGIVESFGLDSEDNLLLDMDSILYLKDWAEDIEDCEECYTDCCEQEDIKPKVDVKKLIVVANEANGNLTLCNRETEEILLFATDHAFANVSVYRGCPEYTFYKIKGCTTFKDWLERIAAQWLK